MKNEQWFKSALIRAIKTMAQTALSMITIGMAISDVDWKQLVSITLVAGLYSILTSIVTGLPEAKTSGEIIINTDAEPNSALVGMALDKELTPEVLKKIRDKGVINFRVQKEE